MPIASLIKDERLALHHAQTELAQAEARATAAFQAMAAIYGPDIASGKEDGVVELSVRGTRVTTMRSTLQVCPDSALTAWFDEDKLPGNSKDVDDQGRRKIDCRRSCFSKILDVLRMRKRVGWAAGEGRDTDGGDGNLVSVIVRDEDRGCFDEFVNTYFPGCESFVTDLVRLPNASNKGGGGQLEEDHT